MRTVVPVPRGGHLPFLGSPALPPLRLTGGFATPTRTVPRQDVYSSFLPCVCHPRSLDVGTHAGSGQSRVRRRLLWTCLGDPFPLATTFALKHSSGQWTRGSEDWVCAFCKCQYHLLCTSVSILLVYCLH